jgi:DNA-binding IscR family transcriptional regulator
MDVRNAAAAILDRTTLQDVVDGNERFRQRATGRQSLDV